MLLTMRGAFATISLPQLVWCQVFSGDHLLLFLLLALLDSSLVRTHTRASSSHFCCSCSWGSHICHHITTSYEFPQQGILCNGQNRACHCCLAAWGGWGISSVFHPTGHNYLHWMNRFFLILASLCCHVLKQIPHKRGPRWMQTPLSLLRV